MSQDKMSSGRFVCYPQNIVFLLVAASWRPILAPDECCPIKTVRDAAGEDSKLNGVYVLKTMEATKRHPICTDGCVYIKDNEEYCFTDKPGPTVVCEV